MPAIQREFVWDADQITKLVDSLMRGSEKKKCASWNSTNAFPTKRLHLNLIDEPDDEELGTKYDLRSPTDQDAAADDGDSTGPLPIRKNGSCESYPE